MSADQVTRADLVALPAHDAIACAQAGGPCAEPPRWVAVNEAAAIRRAAAQVSGLAGQLHDRDHLPPAIRAQVDVAADELRRAAAACAELLDLAAGRPA